MNLSAPPCPSSSPAPARELALFEVGEFVCGLDVNCVQEIQRQAAITAVPRAPDYVRGVVNLRGVIVTVIDLRRKFALGPPPQEGEGQIVIVRRGEESIGLLADTVNDVVMADEAEIEPPPLNLSGVAGRYLKGIYKQEHKLVAILNADELLAVDQE